MAMFFVNDGELFALKAIKTSFGANARMHLYKGAVVLGDDNDLGDFTAAGIEADFDGYNDEGTVPGRAISTWSEPVIEPNAGPTQGQGFILGNPVTFEVMADDAGGTNLIKGYFVTTSDFNGAQILLWAENFPAPKPMITKGQRILLAPKLSLD